MLRLLLGQIQFIHPSVTLTDPSGMEFELGLLRKIIDPVQYTEDCRALETVGASTVAAESALPSTIAEANDIKVLGSGKPTNRRMVAWGTGGGVVPYPARILSVCYLYPIVSHPGCKKNRPGPTPTQETVTPRVRGESPAQ